MDTEVILTWNAANWATVVLMGLIFLAVVLVITQLARRATRKPAPVID